MAEDLRLRALDADLVDAIEPWFDDDEIRLYLGGREWIRRELRLISDMPGRSEAGITVVGRWGWVGFEARVPVAFVGVERYDDGTASGSLVVAPEARRRGVGRRVVRAVGMRVEVAGVTRFVGGVEPGNVASQRCLFAVGADIADEPDEEGMLSISIARPQQR